MNPSDNQYSSSLQQVNDAVQGTIPFTGYDVAALVIVAVGLVLVGLWLQWAVARSRA